jgi:TRAP-type transport system periplasmic protein
MKSFMHLLGTLMFAALIGGIGTAQADSTITLKFASPYPVGHPSYVRAKEYMEDIEKLTNNRVKFSYFPAEQLGKAKDMLTVCGRGVADFCQIHVTYFAGQLPYTNMIVLPYWTTATEGTEIFKEMLETIPELQEEMHKFGVRGLVGTTTPTYDVATVKKPVRSLEDLKGLKLKTAGGIYDNIAKRYGIIPVSIPASETYEAVQRGVVDGVVFNYPSIRSYHLNDLIKYITYGMRCGGYPGAIVVNEKTWEKLPKDIQEAVMKANHNAMEKEGRHWDELNTEVRQQFKNQGIQVYDLTPEQRVAWRQVLNGVGEEYVTQIEKRGFTKARKVFEDYKKIAERVTK